MHSFYCHQIGNPSFSSKLGSIFFSNLSAKLNLNGSLSDYIAAKCGTRQECQLSMLLFIIRIESKTRKFFLSSKIQGTTILKVSHHSND